jgi:hypothetical protein
MTKFVLSSTALALVLAVPAVASAQTAPANGSGSCPPGSWFCAEPPQPQAVPAGQAVQGLKPLPDPDDDEDADETPPAEAPSHHAPSVTYQPAPQPPPPVVVYQPPPPVMVVRPETPPPYEYNPPRRGADSFTRQREWGINLHLEGAMIGHGQQSNTSMGGGGFGLRFKPNRYFGLEADLDFVGGHDYQGDQRNETAFTLNALMFLNPRSHAQVYLLAGFGWSGAHVTNDPSSNNNVDTTYNYFGGQAGIGLELRLTRVLAFNVDLRGFIRGRTDNLAQSQPEFTRVDAYGNTQTTNTSGGGLLSGGMTLYF